MFIVAGSKKQYKQQTNKGNKFHYLHYHFIKILKLTFALPSYCKSHEQWAEVRRIFFIYIRERKIIQ